MVEHAEPTGARSWPLESWPRHAWATHVELRCGAAADGAPGDAIPGRSFGRRPIASSCSDATPGVAGNWRECHHDEMASLSDRILDAIRYAPLDDDVLAKRLGVSQRQSVNQAARRLEAQGLLRRVPGSDGKIVNALPAHALAETALSEGGSTVAMAQRTSQSGATAGHRDRFIGDRITEDEVKEAVRAYLVADGFEVRVAWGRDPGVDIHARHRDGRLFLIEAKAEVGTGGAQQHNYFVGALGELVQRMVEPEATYALALPDNRQYRGLVDRLPALAKRRLRLAVFWVDRSAEGLLVAVEQALAADG